MFRLLALIWNGHIMIENERMKQFSRMRELDKVYRGLFRTLSKIRCGKNVFAEIVNDWKSLTIFRKRSIKANWQGPRYASGTLTFFIFSSCKSSAVFLHKCFLEYVILSGMIGFYSKSNLLLYLLLLSLSLLSLLLLLPLLLYLWGKLGETSEIHPIS